MTTSISERLEKSAQKVRLSGNGFEPIQQGNSLVMGTPTAVVATTLFVTQWITAIPVGGVDRIPVDTIAAKGGSPSLEDLLNMYEDHAA